MQRITQDALRHRIYVKLRTHPKRVLRAMTSKLPHEADKATGEVADTLAQLVAGGDNRLIAPSLRGSGSESLNSNGKWGPDDPDPTEGIE